MFGSCIISNSFTSVLVVCGFSYRLSVPDTQCDVLRVRKYTLHDLGSDEFYRDFFMGHEMDHLGKCPIGA